MLHLQNDTRDWPQAVQRLPDGALVKAVDRGDILRDTKAINSNITTMLRHVGGPQNIFWGDFESNKQLARDFFGTFIDATFREKYARHVDLVQEWNEYLASSHTGAELQSRLTWAEACAWVWKNEYRTQEDYKHIRLALVNAPVGNDINRRFAEIAIHYDCVLSYHAYDKYLGYDQRDPGSWRYHCGRWNAMEQLWGGLRPDWVFGEAGPYAGVVDGWHADNVLRGDSQKYVEAVRRWIREIATTRAYKEGRILGFALFTTGRTGGGWDKYYTEQPELNMLADMINAEWQPGNEDPVPPPPPPPAPRSYNKIAHLVPQGIQRGQYAALRDATWNQKNSIFFSADDWALTLVSSLVKVTSRDLHVWDIDKVLGLEEDLARTALETWVKSYYPDPAPTFHYHRLSELFVANRWSMPVGTPAERNGGRFPPGLWSDANPFANRYKLGNFFYYHPGHDLNLNEPSFDLDRNMPVYAMAGGLVVYAGVPTHNWQGVVVVRHELPEGGFAWTRSAHLSQIFVTKGQWIKREHMLGLTGRNMVGVTAGPYHLHIELCVTDLVERDPSYWPPPENSQVVFENWRSVKQWLLDRA